MKKQCRRGREPSLMEDEVPFDLMEGILCRLPVKSLLRFKGVCRQWLLLIKDPKFIKLHLQRSTQSHTHGSLVTVDVGLSRLCSLDLSTLHVTKKAINQLPDMILVVKFYHRWTWVHHYWTSRHLAIFYSLRSNSWEIKHGIYNIFSEYELILANNEGVYVDGALNWRAGDNNNNNNLEIIISLDLNTEKARTLRLPYYEPNDGFSFDDEGNRRCVGFLVSSFDVVEGNLCVGFIKDTRYYRSNGMRGMMKEFGNEDVVTDIWVMKEFGNDESWTKLFSIQGAERCPPYKPLICIHGDQVLLLSSGSSDSSANLFYYNLKQKIFSLYRDSTPALVLFVFRDFFRARICHESLVPIKQDSAPKNI
ncbi:hypothetical protein COLO4_09405 [Corchorus olitorius]|uniref:F-box domain-containing protein n=1 Tax=Corchorus olitorius TaxID=93759 RepID=A0A1R3KC42_9ROSI|nr:hypothetical protein COLO4_09405 [Corchorus olitorius]